MVGFSFSSQILTCLKKLFGEDTLFLKHFYFSINFTNSLKNICVEQVVLKIRVLNLEKKIFISTALKFEIGNLNHDLQDISD